MCKIYFSFSCFHVADRILKNVWLAFSNESNISWIKEDIWVTDESFLQTSLIVSSKKVTKKLKYICIYFCFSWSEQILFIIIILYEIFSWFTFAVYITLRNALFYADFRMRKVSHMGKKFFINYNTHTKYSSYIKKQFENSKSSVIYNIES